MMDQKLCVNIMTRSFHTQLRLVLLQILIDPILLLQTIKTFLLIQICHKNIKLTNLIKF